MKIKPYVVIYMHDADSSQQLEEKLEVYAEQGYRLAGMNSNGVIVMAHNSIEVPRMVSSAELSVTEESIAEKNSFADNTNLAEPDVIRAELKNFKLYRTNMNFTGHGLAYNYVFEFIAVAPRRSVIVNIKAQNHLDSGKTSTNILSNLGQRVNLYEFLKTSAGILVRANNFGNDWYPDLRGMKDYDNLDFILNICDEEKWLERLFQVKLDC